MTSKKQISIITLFIFFVAILALLFFSFSLKSEPVHDGALVYPGNGFPHFSKDEPVENLNTEMQDYFRRYSFLEVNGSNIIFNDMPSVIKYESSLDVSGPKTNLALDISVASGKAIITIGDIEYIITPDESVIMQSSKKIFPVTEMDLALFENNPKIFGIRLYKIGDNSPFVGFSVYGTYAGDYTDLNFPANISIELTENSSGKIGQWKWIRGLK